MGDGVDPALAALYASQGTAVRKIAPAIPLTVPGVFRGGRQGVCKAVKLGMTLTKPVTEPGEAARDVQEKDRSRGRIQYGMACKHATLDNLAHRQIPVPEDPSVP